MAVSLLAAARSTALGQQRLVHQWLLWSRLKGQLSVSALKAAPADGSTLLLAQGAIATVDPFLYARLAYDPDLDLQPVSLALVK